MVISPHPFCMVFLSYFVEISVGHVNYEVRSSGFPFGNGGGGGVSRYWESTKPR